jgi:hypothetical protein
MGETWSLLFLRVLHDGLEPLLQFAAREQNAMLARLALQADVGSQAHHFPIVSAARVWLAQADDVANLKLGGHVLFSDADYTPGGWKLAV